MNKFEYFDELLHFLKADGGFSAEVDRFRYVTEGYALSIYPEHEKKLPAADITTADLMAYVGSKRDLLDRPGRFFGAWHNKEDGYVYLDVSLAVRDRATALNLARAHDQLAIWDLAASEEIKVEPASV